MEENERLSNEQKAAVKHAALLYTLAFKNTMFPEAKKLAEVLVYAEPDNYDMYHAAFLPRFEEEDSNSAYEYLNAVKDKFESDPRFTEDWLCALVKAEKYEEAEALLYADEAPEIPSLIYLKAAENVYSRKKDSEKLRNSLEKEYELYKTTAALLGLALLHIESGELEQACALLSQIKRASTPSRPYYIALFLHSVCMKRLGAEAWLLNMRENADILAAAAAADKGYYYLKEMEAELRNLLDGAEAAEACRKDGRDMETEFRSELRMAIMAGHKAD